MSKTREKKSRDDVAERSWRQVQVLVFFGRRGFESLHHHLLLLPRSLLDIFLKWQMEDDRIKELARKIYYSDTYQADSYIYRHVILPHELAAILPKDRLLTEDEWRSAGVVQSKGWTHYMIHKPEPHILLFRKLA